MTAIRRWEGYRIRLCYECAAELDEAGMLRPGSAIRIRYTTPTEALAALPIKDDRSPAQRQRWETAIEEIRLGQYEVRPPT